MVKETIAKDSYSEPQPEKKSYEPRPVIALKTCAVELPDCGCTKELVEGREVHGLSRQEREHLRFWGFIE